MNVNELIDSEPSIPYDKEFYCKDQCPVCGSHDLQESDDFELTETSGHDKAGCLKDTISYRIHCNSCGAEFDQEYELGPYVCTSCVVKGEQE